jgi:nucleotidyltransferase/DNA polymerase involved in DNA repair
MTASFRMTAISQAPSFSFSLRNTDVGEVWGVGKRMKAHLESMGIKTAMIWPKLTHGR